MKHWGMIVCALAVLCCQRVPVTNVVRDEGVVGWKHVLVDGGVREDVWSMQGDTLICQGKPLGYLFTPKSYQDFRMTFEWRWAPGKEAGNSGVLLRIQGEPHGFMPKCVEAQLKSGSAGDVWGFFGAAVLGEQARRVEVKEHKDLGDFHGYKALQAAEKAPGEWNQYQIDCVGDRLELRINGVLVNQITGLDVVAGPIGLQSEGAEIHFRNVVIESL